MSEPKMTGSPVKPLDYQAGLQRLLKLLGPKHHRHTDVSLLEYRLRENLVEKERYGGDTDSSRIERAKIIDALNRLTLSELGASFNRLCETDRPLKLTRFQHYWEQFNQNRETWWIQIQDEDQFDELVDLLFWASQDLDVTHKQATQLVVSLLNAATIVEIAAILKRREWCKQWLQDQCFELVLLGIENDREAAKDARKDARSMLEWRRKEDYQPESGKPPPDASAVDQNLVDRWLQGELGLDHNPFQYLDSESDPDIHSYPIGLDDDFEPLWGEWPSFLFAPAGGGKTVSRIYLTKQCREMRGLRRFFPITFLLPALDVPGSRSNEECLFTKLLQRTGDELFFHLAWQAREFPEWEATKRQALRQALETTGIPVERYLDQIKSNSLRPLLHPRDQTIKRMLGKPGPDDKSIANFCNALRETCYNRPAYYHPPQERLLTLWQLIRNDLGYEAIFILVDSADTHSHSPKDVCRALGPLLKYLRDWAEMGVFIKFFLPVDVKKPLCEQDPSPLSQIPNVVTIEWTADKLMAVLTQRLLAASTEDPIETLKQLGGQSFEWEADKLLVDRATPVVPREAVCLARMLLSEHLFRVGPNGRLETEGLERTLEQYKSVSQTPSPK